MGEGSVITVYLFWRRRPTDKQPWPTLYTDRALAIDAPDRISAVLEVQMPEQPDAEGKFDPIESHPVAAWMDAEGRILPAEVIDRARERQPSIVNSLVQTYRTPLYSSRPKRRLPA